MAIFSRLPVDISQSSFEYISSEISKFSGGISEEFPTEIPKETQPFVLFIDNFIGRFFGNILEKKSFYKITFQRKRKKD